MKTKILTLAIFIAIFGLFSVTLAQTSGDATTGDEVVGEELEGIEVEKIEEVPSNFGLWWRGVKEGVSLFFSFDPVVKAEKQLQFAEEHLAIAQKMAEESENEKVQERAQKMIEKANQYMEKIEDKRDKWTENINGRTEKLIKNLATHQLRKERIISEIEETASENTLEVTEGLKEEALMGGKRLINAIENENISEITKAHLENVKERIEGHLEDISEFKEAKQEILQEVKDEDDDSGIKESLNQLRNEMKEKSQERTQEYHEAERQLRNRAGLNEDDD